MQNQLTSFSNSPTVKSLGCALNRGGVLMTDFVVNNKREACPTKLFMLIRRS